MRVHPGARRDRVVGRLADGTLKLEVTARPTDGRANEAVVRLLAERLGIPRARVRVARGHTSRGKVVEIEGMSERDVTERLLESGGAEDARAE